MNTLNTCRLRRQTAVKPNLSLELTTVPFFPFFIFFIFFLLKGGAQSD
jgi:hypothetical protein